MAVLPDYLIEAALDEGSLVIEPLVRGVQIQPASVDLRLHHRFCRWQPKAGPFGPFLDPTDPDLADQVAYMEADELWIAPGEFLLGSTVERVTLPATMLGRVNGRSSIGRLGLQIHATAGFIDPGFSGTITLEISNIASHRIRLVAGMRIAQLEVERMVAAARCPYGHPDRGSKYQGQTAVTPSRLHKDFQSD